MKKILLQLLFLFCATFSSQAEVGFKIKGKVNGGYSGYIYLTYQEKRDSALVVNGAFEFVGKVDKPLQASLNLKPTANVAWVYLENSLITIEGDFSVSNQDGRDINLYRVTRITGSYSQKVLDEYRKFCNANRSKADFNALRFEKLKVMFANDSSEALNGWLLGDLAINSPVFSYGQFKELYAMLDTTALQKYDVKMIETGLRNMLGYGIGESFMTFELPNENGNNVHSSKYAGKMLLIDFWASWCGPCRAKHPELTELHKKYQSKNFELISISTDKDMNAWRKAIIKDNLKWENLSDVDGKTINELGIQAIPFSYLLDEQGKIVGVNLTLKEIDGILEKRLR